MNSYGSSSRRGADDDDAAVVATNAGNGSAVPLKTRRRPGGPPPPHRRHYQHVAGQDNEEEDGTDHESTFVNNASPKLTSTHAAAPHDSPTRARMDDHDSIDNDYDRDGYLLISVDEAMERLGMGRFQYVLLLASGLCFAADAMQVIMLSFLTVVLQQEWQLTQPQVASMTSLLFAGSMVGTLVLGPLADTLGRRPIFLMAALIISVFGMGTALSSNYWMLIAMIFLVGVGVGGLTVPFDILAEFLPAAGRGINLLLIEYFWTLGCLLVVVLAYTTLHNGGDHWRIFVGLCAVPCLVSLFMGFFCVPESARWLCAEQRTDEALQVLRHAAHQNGLDVDAVFPSHVRLRPDEEEQQATVADLLAPKWRGITLRLWGTWGAFAFGYYGVIMATTKVFAGEEDQNPSSGGGGGGGNFTMTPSAAPVMGYDNTKVRWLETLSATNEGYNFDYSAIFVSSSAELVGTTLVIFAIDKVGRIPSQVVSYTLAGISVAALCLLSSWGSARVLLVGTGFLARVFEMSGTCVTWVSTAEILTTEVRATGHATANALARIGAFCAPFLVEGDTPIRRVGVIMLVVHLFTAICVAKLPETKGKSMGSDSSTRSHDGRESESDTIMLVASKSSDNAQDNDAPTTNGQLT